MKGYMEGCMGGYMEGYMEGYMRNVHDEWSIWHSNLIFTGIRYLPIGIGFYCYSSCSPLGFDRNRVYVV